jgi:AcrR family transcriptional regulator
MTDRPVRRNETLRDTWFDAANEILASEGYGALKLAALCKKLGVTTGSFYHSFNNWQDFTESLLANWLAERTEQIILIAQQNADPVDQLTMLRQAAGEFFHRSEAAIRVWAGVDDRVAAVQRKVDEDRPRTVAQAMPQIDGPERAESYATWAVGTLIGYEMLSAHQQREDLLWALEMILENAVREGRGLNETTAATEKR